MIISDGRRLAYYSVKANSGFWSQHWLKSIGKVEWEKAERGFLGWFEESSVKYLPKKGKIIEAGCGLGYYVLALERRGYDVEGVEWSKEAVGLIKKRFPELKVRTGDVRNLAVKDGYYSGYISLGVVEHFKSGPEDYLREANRILKRGGVAFVSVPYFNLLRRIKNLFGFYRGSPVGLDFYQYAFTQIEIEDFIQKSGFKVVSRFHYDAYKSIKEELPFLRNLLVLLKTHCSPSFRTRSGIYIDSRLPARNAYSIAVAGGHGNDKESNSNRRPWWLKLVDRYFGHMTMVVCIKR